MFSSKYVWSNLAIKEIRTIQKEGKSPLRFVDLIDPATYETSGQYIYMPDDRNEQLPPQGTLVDVYTKPGMFNGRPNLTFASIKPTTVDSKKAAGSF